MLDRTTPDAIRVDAIPRLDSPIVYKPASPRDGLPQIILPSGHAAYHVARYRDVKHLLSEDGISRRLCNVPDGPTFLPGPTPKELLLNLDMPDHARSRKLVRKDFSAAGVDELRTLVETSARDSVRAMLAGRKAPDLFASVLDEIPSLVICRILGVPLEDRAEFRGWGRVIQLAPHDDVAGIEVSVDRTYGYLLDLIRGLRPTEPDGFIRRHADSRSDGPDELSDEDIAGVLLGILVGGDNNALSVMTKIVYAMLVAPDLWRRIVTRPDIIPQAVEEMIRLIPIGLLSVFPRIATSDIDLSIGTIPAGSIVYPDAFLANRDPDAYVDPLVVDFERKGPPHLQFGHGVHFCMGPHLARLEIATVLRVLVAEAPSLAFDADPETLRWQVGAVLRRPDELPVAWAHSQAEGTI